MTALEIVLGVLACLGMAGTVVYACAFSAATLSPEEQELIYEGGMRRKEKEEKEAKKKRETEDRRIKALAFEAIYEVAKGLPPGNVEAATLHHQAYRRARSESSLASIAPVSDYR